MLTIIYNMINDANDNKLWVQTQMPESCLHKARLSVLLCGLSLRNNQWSTCWSITLDVFPRRAVWPDVPPADRSQQPTRGAAHRSGARRVPMWAGRRAMLTLGLHHDSCWNSRSRFLTMQCNYYFFFFFLNKHAYFLPQPITTQCYTMCFRAAENQGE